MGLVFSFSTSGFAATKNNDNDNLKVLAEAAILVDAASGRILYSKNIDELLPTASMSKMMTEYLVMETIKEGRIKWDDRIHISDYVYKISQNTKLSNVPLRKDMEYSVKELYEAMAIYSANGATIALAEHIAGSETDFVKMMNEKAAELDLTDYKFVNCTGLNNNDLYGMQPEGTLSSDEDMMSARATATLAYRLIKDYPEVFRFSDIPKKKFQKGTSDEIQMDNWNWMLPDLVFGYEGMDGLKTGSTDQAGYCFTGTAKRNGIRLISVVMKTKSFKNRFMETQKIMDYGFKNFITKEILPANQQFEVKIEGGRWRKTEVTNEKPLTVLIKKGEEYTVTPVFRVDNPAKNGAVIAPVAKGAVVGRVAPDFKGNQFAEYLTEKLEKTAGVETITPNEIKKAGFFFSAWYSIGDMIANLWSNIYQLTFQKIVGLWKK